MPPKEETVINGVLSYRYFPTDDWTEYTQKELSTKIIYLRNGIKALRALLEGNTENA